MLIQLPGRPIKVTAAVLAVFALVPSAFAAVRHTVDGAPGAAAPAIIASLTCVASLLILWRTRTPGEHLVALLLALVGGQGAVSAAYSAGLRPLWLPGARVEPSFALLLTVLWAAANFTAVRMMQCFPRPVGRAAFSHTNLWHRTLSALLNPWWLLVLSAALLLAGLAGGWIVGNLTVGVLALSYGWAGFRSADEVARRKLFWMLFTGVGFVTLSAVWLGLSAAIAALDWPAATTSILARGWSVLVALIALAGPCLAVWAAPAIDPRPWIRHTALYGISVAGLLFGFALLENVLSNAVMQLLGVSGTIVNSAIAAVLALLLGPLHGRLDSWSRKRIRVRDHS